MERVRQLLGGGASVGQGVARTSRAASRPRAAQPEESAVHDDKCSSDDSWEVVEAYPSSADTVATSAAVEEADIRSMVKGNSTPCARVCTVVQLAMVAPRNALHDSTGPSIDWSQPYSDRADPPFKQRFAYVVRYFEERAKALPVKPFIGL